MLQKISLALALIAFSIVFLIRYDAVRPIYKDGDRVRISGILQDEPQIYGDRQRIKIADLSFYAPRFPEYHYGDKLRVEGVVKKGERGFSLEGAKIGEIGDIREKGREIFLLEFREKILDSFGKFLPAKEAGLLKGMILGTKNSLDSQFFDQLRKTGTLHVVVASGSNVSLFAGAIIVLLSSYITRRRTLLVSLLIVWFYVFMVGGQPPIVRAALFSSIGMVGQIFGREAGVLRVLLVVGGIMLLVNPLWIFDLGFQLSFAATMGILAFNEKILGKLGSLGRLGVPNLLVKDLATTLAAQVFVTPILFLNFGQVSLISPLVNMLILWTVPPIMIGGTIVGVVGMLGEVGGILGQIGAWLIYPLLWWFVTIVQLFAQL